MGQMIEVTASGSFDNLESLLKNASNPSIFDILSSYGERGVAALQSATPKRTGLTAMSWGYEIVKDKNSWAIIWTNTNIVEGRPVAVLLQYGHATGTGGYVEGRPYINEALKPIFDEMSDAGWRVVTAS